MIASSLEEILTVDCNEVVGAVNMCDVRDTKIGEEVRGRGNRRSFCVKIVPVTLLLNI